MHRNFPHFFWGSSYRNSCVSQIAFKNLHRVDILRSINLMSLRLPFPTFRRKIFVTNEIIHNPTVNGKLEGMGMSIMVCLMAQTGFRTGLWLLHTLIPVFQKNN